MPLYMPGLASSLLMLFQALILRRVDRADEAGAGPVLGVGDAGVREVERDRARGRLREVGLVGVEGDVLRHAVLLEERLEADEVLLVVGPVVDDERRRLGARACERLGPGDGEARGRGHRGAQEPASGKPQRLGHAVLPLWSSRRRQAPEWPGSRSCARRPSAGRCGRPPAPRRRRAGRSGDAPRGARRSADPR